MSLPNRKADGRQKANNYVKKCKSRLERRKAKNNPECFSGYGKYKGWVS